MIDKFLELSKVCDIKAIQEEAKSLKINSIDDVKNYFMNKNIEISDELAAELLKRAGFNEISLEELSTISAGTKYYTDGSICPICGYTGGVAVALKIIEPRQFDICGEPYTTYKCYKCQHVFVRWINLGYWEG